MKHPIELILLDAIFAHILGSWTLRNSKLVKQCWTFVVGAGDPGSVIIGSIL